MKRSEYAPIDDLLPQLRAAALKLRAHRSNANSQALERLLSQVAQRWHINVHGVHGSIDGWNNLVDTLDEQHPGWRGYSPGQCDEEAAA